MKCNYLFHYRVPASELRLVLRADTRNTVEILSQEKKGPFMERRGAERRGGERGCGESHFSQVTLLHISRALSFFMLPHDKCLWPELRSHLSGAGH